MEGNTQKFQHINHLILREVFPLAEIKKKKKNTLVSIYISENVDGRVDILCFLNNEHCEGHNEPPCGSSCHLVNCILTHLVMHDIFIAYYCDCTLQCHYYVTSAVPVGFCICVEGGCLCSCGCHM